MAAQSNKERQDDEIQVLQAIFMDDFHDLRQKDAWKVRTFFNTLNLFTEKFNSK